MEAVSKILKVLKRKTIDDPKDHRALMTERGLGNITRYLKSIGVQRITGYILGEGLATAFEN